MRFALLAVATLVAGTGAAGVQLGIVPVPDQMARAVRALGGDSGQTGRVEIKPIRTIYDEVLREVTAPDDSATRIGLKASPVPTVLPPDYAAIQKWVHPTLPPIEKFNVGPSIAAQTKQFNDHMEDVRNFARNPGGWHGAPP